MAITSSDRFAASRRRRRISYKAKRFATKALFVLLPAMVIATLVAGYATGAIQYENTGFGYKYTVHIGDFHYTYSRGYSFGDDN